MKVSIVSPLGKIYDGEVKEIVLPGSEGEFGVLDGHSPLVTTLKPGVIVIKKDSSKEVIAVNWGYVEVAPTHVNVLVDEAVPVSGENSSEIAEKIEKAKKLIREAADSDILTAAVESRIEHAVRV